MTRPHKPCEHFNGALYCMRRMSHSSYHVCQMTPEAHAKALAEWKDEVEFLVNNKLARVGPCMEMENYKQGQFYCLEFKGHDDGKGHGHQFNYPSAEAAEVVAKLTDGTGVLTSIGKLTPVPNITWVYTDPKTGKKVSSSPLIQCEWVEANTGQQCLYAPGHSGSHSGPMDEEEYKEALISLAYRQSNAFLQPVEVTVGNSILIHDGSLYIDDVKITNATAVLIQMAANEITKVDVQMEVQQEDLTVNLETDKQVELTRRRT